MKGPVPDYHGPGHPRDDIVLPFQVEPHGIRGSLVTLGDVTDTILSNHGHPGSIARLEGELLALAACLASTLKFEGVFTLQVNGSGPLKTLMADVTSDGALRSYAGFDAGAIAKAESEHGADMPLQRLTGGGYMAFTVDQAGPADRYQRMIELAGPTLAECTNAYFLHSEEIATGLMAAASPMPGGTWRASALMIQKTAGKNGDDQPQRIESPAFDDGWRTAVVLMSSCTTQELLDPTIAPEALLYRLFHETGVRVYPEHKLTAQCRCSTDKVDRVLRSLSAEQIIEMTVDGAVSVVCEFCKTERRYDDAALAELRGAAATGAVPNGYEQQ